VDLLCCDEDDGCASFLEFAVSRLKLSQLPVAVGSPGPTKEYEYKRFAVVVGQANYIAFGRGKREIRRHVARVQCVGVCPEHSMRTFSRVAAHSRSPQSPRASPVATL